MTERTGLGKMGEKAVAAKLKKSGYSILDMNYRTRGGEIDIICSRGEYIVFVEVKTRTGDTYGLPAEAVTYSKTQKIYSTAQNYIISNDISLQPRFDVAEVYASDTGGKVKIERIEIIENAF